MALLVYNEETKKLESKIGREDVIHPFRAILENKIGWRDVLHPFIAAESASALVRYAIDQVKYVVEQVNLTGALSEDDSENIKTIIEEGRKQKVDEMNIEMSRDVAMGMNVDGIKGADVTFGSKGKTKYVMNVKYKYDN